MIQNENHLPRNSASKGTLSATQEYDMHVRELEIAAQKASYGCAPTCPAGFTSEIGICLYLCMINKGAQELVVASIPTIAIGFLGWSADNTGFFMAIMGSMMIPASLVASWLFAELEDRRSLLMYLFVSITSGLLLLNVPGVEYSAFRYIFANIFIFVSLTSCEGLIMALLSKLYTPELARGTFNSGLLATEASNIGRIISDFSISLIALHNSGNAIINCIFVPMILLLITSSLSVLKYWAKFST